MNMTPDSAPPYPSPPAHNGHNLRATSDLRSAQAQQDPIVPQDLHAEAQTQHAQDQDQHAQTQAQHATHDLPALLDLMPFAALLGIELQKAEPAEVIGNLEYSPRLTTAGAILHGGALMTLADTLGAICAYLNLPPGGRTATTTSATNFLRPVGAGRITGTATPVHIGRSVIVVRVDVTDARGNLAATTTQTQAVLPGPQSQESRT